MPFGLTSGYSRGAFINTNNSMPDTKNAAKAARPRSRKLIEDNQDKVHAVAKALLEWETIGSDQIDEIMAGKVPTAPKDWTPRIPPAGGDGGGSGTAPVIKPDAAPTAA